MTRCCIIATLDNASNFKVVYEGWRCHLAEGSRVWLVRIVLGGYEVRILSTQNQALAVFYLNVLVWQRGNQRLHTFCGVIKLRGGIWPRHLMYN